MFLKFVVVDTGIGIPPEKISRLFKMFAQLDAPETSRYDGYGVGLFICSRLLDLLGGTVTAESDGKSGSTFTVCIPAAPVACCVPPHIEPLANMCAVLYFAQQHSYAFMEPPLTRAHIPVHTLLTLDALPELLANVGNNVRVVFFTDLSLAQTLRRAISPNVAYTTVALAYAQKWKLYPDKEGLTPLFRPVQHAKIITALQSAMPSPRPSIAGTTFTDPKDAVLTGSTSGPKPAVAATAPSGAKLHVLVVEDNLVNSKLLCRILEVRSFYVCYYYFFPFFSDLCINEGSRPRTRPPQRSTVLRLSRPLKRGFPTLC